MPRDFNRAATDSPPVSDAWQLQMFQRTLKKRQKLQAIAAMIGPLIDKRCLLITHGDNNGALNWHFKQLGGTWSWADFDQESVRQIRALTGDPVELFSEDLSDVSFTPGAFDLIVTIDVHEHIPKPAKLNQTLKRLSAPGGRVLVSTPNGDESLLAVKIKHAIGMTPDIYGHQVVGFTASAISDQLKKAGFQPVASRHYAKFFTEMLELLINVAYVKILSRHGRAQVSKGQIAPQNEEQLGSVGGSYRVYSLLYPIFWSISKLDNLIPSNEGYAVIVAAEKPLP